MTPAFRPRWCSVELALDALCPESCGTLIGAGPLLIVTLTVAVVFTRAPAEGLCANAVPGSGPVISMRERDVQMEAVQLRGRPVSRSARGATGALRSRARSAPGPPPASTRARAGRTRTRRRCAGARPGSPSGAGSSAARGESDRSRPAAAFACRWRKSRSWRRRSRSESGTSPRSARVRQCRLRRCRACARVSAPAIAAAL